jgi:hypothetical protein
VVALARNNKRVQRQNRHTSRHTRSLKSDFLAQNYLFLRRKVASTDGAREPGPGSLQATLEVSREFAVTHLAKLRDLISHPESIDLARTVLAEHFATFVLEPTIHEGEPVYRAQGKVDFFGDEAVARTGGAGGPVSSSRH